jgi:hypothetical protein
MEQQVILLEDLLEVFEEELGHVLVEAEAS